MFIKEVDLFQGIPSHVIDGRGWLIRTTMYSPHQLAIDVTFVAGSDAKEGLFDDVGP